MFEKLKQNKKNKKVVQKILNMSHQELSNEMLGIILQRLMEAIKRANFDYVSVQELNCAEHNLVREVALGGIERTKLSVDASIQKNGYERVLKGDQIVGYRKIKLAQVKPLRPKETAAEG